MVIKNVYLVKLNDWLVFLVVEFDLEFLIEAVVKVLVKHVKLLLLLNFKLLYLIYKLFGHGKIEKDLQSWQCLKCCSATCCAGVKLLR